MVTDEMVKAAAQAAYGKHFERYQKMMRKALSAAVEVADKADPWPNMRCPRCCGTGLVPPDFPGDDVS